MKCPASMEAPLITIGPPILSNIGILFAFNDMGGALISMAAGSSGSLLRGRRLNEKTWSLSLRGLSGSAATSAGRSGFSLSDAIRIRSRSAFNERKPIPTITLRPTRSIVSPAFKQASRIPRSFSRALSPLTNAPPAFPRSRSVQPFLSRRMEA